MKPEQRTESGQMSSNVHISDELRELNLIMFLKPWLSDWEEQTFSSFRHETQKKTGIHEEQEECQRSKVQTSEVMMKGNHEELNWRQKPDQST